MSLHDLFLENLIQNDPPGTFHLRYHTAKGSIYGVWPDGTTTRMKSYHPEHGGDEGEKPRSQRTMYLKPGEAGLWMGMQATYPPGVVVAIRQLTQDGQWGLFFVSGPNRGKGERGTLIRPTWKPQKGLTPVELWRDGTIIHFGNAITRVEMDSQYAEYFKKYLQTP